MQLQNQLNSMKLEIAKKNFEIDEIQAILSNEKEEKVIILLIFLSSLKFYLIFRIN